MNDTKRDCGAMSAASPRVIRLTDKLLADLPVGVECITDEIDYLTDALEKRYITNEKQLAAFTAKRDSLVRTRDWLASKISAELHQRAQGALHEPS